DRRFAAHLQGLVVAHQVDREAAAARRLAADRAIAKLIGIGCVAHHAETHRPAAAGTFELLCHGWSSLRVTHGPPERLPAPAMCARIAPCPRLPKPEPSPPPWPRATMRAASPIPC